ncbi:hypothetical protein NPIL_298261, partial [Nephila pilipes]
ELDVYFACKDISRELPTEDDRCRIPPVLSKAKEYLRSFCVSEDTKRRKFLSNLNLVK